MTTMLSVVNEFNNQLLADVGVVDLTGEGMYSFMHNGKPKPVSISKKRLVNTTKEFLRDGDWTQRIAFGPLSEQINEGPSPILNALKSYIVERCKLSIRELALALMELATEPKRHKALSAKGAVFLTGLRDADQKSVDTLRKVFDAVTDVPEKRLISMYLKNGSKSGALRSCNVSFPIMDDAENGETETFFGVKMPRKTKDKALIVALLEYILGTKDERERFTQESSDQDAPYFHCLLLSFHALATRINELVKVHSPACPQLVGHAFGLEWAEHLSNFSEWAKAHSPAITDLPGNSGVSADLEDTKRSVFEAEGTALGVKDDLDLPWNETDDDRLKRRPRPSGLTMSTDAPLATPTRQREEVAPKRSLKDLLNGPPRTEERTPGRRESFSSTRSTRRGNSW